MCTTVQVSVRVTPFTPWIRETILKGVHARGLHDRDDLVRPRDGHRRSDPLHLRNLPGHPPRLYNLGLDQHVCANLKGCTYSDRGPDQASPLAWFGWSEPGDVSLDG